MGLTRFPFAAYSFLIPFATWEGTFECRECASFRRHLAACPPGQPMARLLGMVMDALEILRGYKKEVASRWVEAVFATYPLETTGFLRTKNDPFTNPVAHMTREAAATLYDAMIGEDVEPEMVKAALERFVKLRAVQKFAPSQNMAVFYLMKPIIREMILPVMREKGQLDAYLAMESRLDTLALLAFDIYTAARETVAESRIREIRNQHAQLARWASRLEEGKPPARSGE